MAGLAEWVLDPGIPPLLIYALLFVGCVLESFFPPWPADVIALYAGFLAGRGLLDPTLAFTIAIVGTQVGVMGAFWISRHWGRALLGGPLGRYLPVVQLVRLEAWFERYGAPAIAISRFFPGIRALVTPAAGLAGFAAWKVWLFAGVSVVVWNVVVVGAGLFAGSHLEGAKALLIRYNTVAGAVVLLALLGGLGLLAYRRFGTVASSQGPGARR